MRIFRTESVQRHQPEIASGWAVVLCLVLLALVTAMQVGHVHLSEPDSTHCTLCLILQTAAPVGVAAAAILLVALGACSPLPERAVVVRCRTTRLFIRPPPRNR